MTDRFWAAWPYRLTAGHTEDPAEGACAMDAVNWLAHGKHGDEPECACPVIGAFVIAGNDTMPNTTRQRLLPYLHRIAGSRSSMHEGDRLRLIALGGVRDFAIHWLLQHGLNKAALDLLDGASAANFGRDGAIAYRTIAASVRPALYRKNWPGILKRNGEVALTVPELILAMLAAAEANQINAAYLSAMLAYRADVWMNYLHVLDAALTLGPQGEPWSADVAAEGLRRYVAAGGTGALVTEAA